MLTLIFFEEQRATLCTWHYADPADETELSRTQRIASYQGGKANPFVLDCTLAERTYCTEVGECETVGTTVTDASDTDIRLIQFGCNINLIINTTSHKQIRNSIINSAGQILYFHDTVLSEGKNNIDIDGCNLPHGIYFLNSVLKGDTKIIIKTLKFVIADRP